MDETTRFWIIAAKDYSQRREIADARAVFQDQKAKTGKSQRKSKIIHDGLLSYDEAYILEGIYFCRNHAESRVFKQCNFYN